MALQLGDTAPDFEATGRAGGATAGAADRAGRPGLYRPAAVGGYAWAFSSSADGTTTAPSGGWVNRIGFPNGSRSAQSVP